MTFFLCGSLVYWIFFFHKVTKSSQVVAVMNMNGFLSLCLDNSSILVDSIFISFNSALTELGISRKLYQGTRHFDIPLNLGPQASNDSSPGASFVTPFILSSTFFSGASSSSAPSPDLTTLHWLSRIY